MGFLYNPLQSQSAPAASAAYAVAVTSATLLLARCPTLNHRYSAGSSATKIAAAGA